MIREKGEFLGHCYRSHSECPQHHIFHVIRVSYGRANWKRYFLGVPDWPICFDKSNVIHRENRNEEAETEIEAETVNKNIGKGHNCTVKITRRFQNYYSIK